MHALVENDPRWQRAVQETRKAETAAARYMRAEDDGRMAHERKRADARARYMRGEDVTLLGEYTPDDPTFAFELTNHAIAKRRAQDLLLGALGTELMPKLRAREAEVFAIVRKVIDEIRPTLAEIEQLRVTAMQISDGDTLASPRHDHVTVVDLIQIATAGGSVIDSPPPAAERALPASFSAPVTPKPEAADAAPIPRSHSAASLHRGLLHGRR